MRIATIALVVLSCDAVRAEAQDLVDFWTEPSLPVEGKSFELVLLFDVVGCWPTIESVSVTPFAISIDGVGGSPPGGGCSGAIYRDFEVRTVVGPLPAGAYGLEAEFRDRRDGTLFAGLAGGLFIAEALAVPSLSFLGKLVAALTLAILGLRRFAV